MGKSLYTKNKQETIAGMPTVAIALSPLRHGFGGQAGGDQKTTVAVGLSGGVDSSVAAALLKKRGYRVVAFFMKNWSDTFGLKDSECPWVQDRRDAMAVAAKLDIPFHTLDFEEDYKREVLDYFFREYKAGCTPNPDVLCNSQIKFGAFLEKATELGADFIATGHYARLYHTEPLLSSLRPAFVSRRETSAERAKQGSRPLSLKLDSLPMSIGTKGRGNDNKVCQLLKAKDQDKDQTYFLHRLTQSQLGRAIFPIGDYTKPQVRRLAKKFGLPNWDKKDSQGLCFVGHIRLKQFLSQKIKERPGDIVTMDGKVVGEHKGLFWYTIGQRQGIGIGGIGPFYVLEKDLANNRLIVTRDRNDSRLWKKEIDFTNANRIAGEEPKFPLRCQGRIRYREPLVDCRIIQTSKGPYRAAFAKPVWAPAAGQSIVFYKGEACLGGGIIK